jgi:hypothetical protein
MAKSLSSWSSKFIGNIKMQILLATEVILHLDVAMDSRMLSPEERAIVAFSRRSCWGLLLSSGPWHGKGRVSFGSGRATPVLVSSTPMLAT